MQWHYKFPPGLLPVSLNASCFKDAGPACWRFVSHVFVRRKGGWERTSCGNEPGLSPLLTRGARTSGNSKEDGQTTHLITMAEIRRRREDGVGRQSRKKRIRIYKLWKNKGGWEDTFSLCVPLLRVREHYTSWGHHHSLLRMPPNPLNI